MPPPRSGGDAETGTSSPPQRGPGDHDLGSGGAPQPGDIAVPAPSAASAASAAAAAPRRGKKKGAKRSRGARGAARRGRGGRGALPPPEVYESRQAPASYLTPAEQDVFDGLQRSRGSVIDKEFELPGVAALPAGSLAALLFSCAAEPRRPVLAKAKGALNQVKDRLDSKDIKIWGQLTWETNPMGEVVRTVRRDLAPEMMTTAWAKMWEMLVAYGDELVPPSPPVGSDTAVPFRSVHLCEAPGAFVCALNHFVETRRERVAWDWCAMTLNPHFEGNDLGAMVDDDKFINASARHWFFGADNSGDVTVRANVEGLVERVRTLAAARDSGNGGKVFLVTADGSVDCQDNPNEQESMTGPLHFCELVASVAVLERGGAAILKAFTIFENETVALLYMFGLLFERVRVCKPPSSKQGNSEKYIVATGFRGIAHDDLTALVSHVASAFPADRAMLPLARMDGAWLATLDQCGLLFGELQQVTIRRNLEIEAIQTTPAFAQWRTSNTDTRRFFAWDHLHRRFRIDRLVPARFVAAREGRSVQLTGADNNSGRAVIGLGNKRARIEGSLAARRAAATRGGSADDSGGDDADGGGADDADDDADEPTAVRPPLPPLPLPLPPPPPPPPPHPPAISAAVERMMARMEYINGSGLGRHGQGMTEALAPESRPHGWGLGFASDGIAAAAAAAAPSPSTASTKKRLRDPSHHHGSAGERPVVVSDPEIVCATGPPQSAALLLAEFCETTAPRWLMPASPHASSPASSRLIRPGAVVVATASERGRTVRLSRFCDDLALENLRAARRALGTAQLPAAYALWAETIGADQLSSASVVGELTRMLSEAPLCRRSFTTRGAAEEHLKDAPPTAASCTVLIVEPCGFFAPLASDPAALATSLGVSSTVVEIADSRSSSSSSSSSSLSSSLSSSSTSANHLRVPGRTSRVHIVLADALCVDTRLSLDVDDAEWQSKRALANALDTALATLRPGGSLIVRCGETLSRVTAGLLFITSSCFRTVTIAKPAGAPPFAQDRFIIAAGFGAAGNSGVVVEEGVRETLRTALAAMSSSSSSSSSSLSSSPELDVTEIVPVAEIVEQAEEFRTWLTVANELATARETRALSTIRKVLLL
jgi:cap2 methyltransferase